MRHLIVITAILLISCVSTIIETEIKTSEEVQLQSIRELLESGSDLKALHNISSFEKDYPNYNKNEIALLSKTAKDMIINNFETAVTEEDWFKVLRYYYSSNAAGLGDYEYPLSLGDIFLKYSEKLLSNKENVSAVLYLEKALNLIEIPPEILIRSGEAVIEGNNRAMLKQMIAVFDKIEQNPPDEFTEFLTRDVTPSIMMHGVMTIWVNKGIRIENGMGLPDSTCCRRRTWNSTECSLRWASSPSLMSVFKPFSSRSQKGRSASARPRGVSKSFTVRMYGPPWP